MREQPCNCAARGRHDERSRLGCARTSIPRRQDVDRDARAQYPPGVSDSDSVQVQNLQQFGYDATMQAEWQRKVADGAFCAANNVVDAPPVPAR